MAMTAEERRRVLRMLDEMDRAERRRVMASLKAFMNWLSMSASLLYRRIKDDILEIWDSLRSWFS